MRFTIAASLLAAGFAKAKWYERDAKDSIVQELGVKLSASANVILPGENTFEDKNKRWQAWASPHISAVVDVRSEQDVQETVRYATKHGIPFLAISGTHGSTSAASLVKNAIQIDLRNLNHLSVSPDGNSVTVGGGIKAKLLIDHLWARGKQTVTGACECVGLTAVALGGGHGFLQGYYGLLSDQILSMRVVLADGTVVTASEGQNEDLFWAMRGAGHNFGIVTEMEYKIYDVGEGKETWSWEAFTLPATSENVRKVYGIAAETLDTQPEGMMQYGLIMANPSVSKDPVIMHMVTFNGPLADIREYTQAYHDLEPMAFDSAEGTYIDVPRWMQIDEAGLVCNIQDFMPGAGVIRFPVDVPAYNLSALVSTVQKFIDVVTAGPEFAGSFMMIEQYSSHAVRAADSSKSAFANRQDKLLLAPALLYPSVDAKTGVKDERLDEKAKSYGEEMKRYLVDGARNMGGSHAYVNYAYGGESLEDMYGKDGLDRLLELKQKYDAQNRFGYYAPLAPAKKESEEGHSEL